MPNNVNAFNWNNANGNPNSLAAGRNHHTFRKLTKNVATVNNPI